MASISPTSDRLPLDGSRAIETSTTNTKFLDAATKIPPLKDPSQIALSINDTHTIDLNSDKLEQIRAINFVLSVSFGALVSGLGIAGAFASPIVLAISGSFILMLLAAGAYSVGVKELLLNLGITLSAGTATAIPVLTFTSKALLGFAPITIFLGAIPMLVLSICLASQSKNSNKPLAGPEFTVHATVPEERQGPSKSKSQTISSSITKTFHTAQNDDLNIPEAPSIPEVPLAPPMGEAPVAAKPAKIMLTGEPEAPAIDRSQYRKLGVDELKIQIEQIESYLTPFEAAMQNASTVIASEEDLKAQLIGNRKLLENSQAELAKYRSQSAILAEIETSGSQITYSYQLVPPNPTDITYYSEAAWNAMNASIDEKNAQIQELNKQLTALRQKPRALIPKISPNYKIGQALSDLNRITDTCRNQIRETEHQIRENEIALTRFTVSPIAGKNMLEFKEIVAGKELLLDAWKSALKNRKSRLDELRKSPAKKADEAAKTEKAPSSEADRIVQEINGIVQDPIIKGLTNANSAGVLKALDLHKAKFFQKGIIKS